MLKTKVCIMIFSFVLRANGDCLEGIPLLYLYGSAVSVLCLCLSVLSLILYKNSNHTKIKERMGFAFTKKQYP